MIVLLTLLLLCVFYILLNYYRTFCYWKNKGIKFIRPLPIVGNSLPTLTNSVTYSEYVVNLYNQFPSEKCCGTFQYSQPILLLRDLNLIKRIFTKEFETFSEHPLPSDPDENTLWGRNLFAAKGETWKQLRQIISPVFTTTKLKTMFGLMGHSAKQLVEYLDESDKEVIEVELRDIFKRYSSDTIASIAFGIECNSFRDRNNDFIKMGAELTNFGGLQKLKRLLYTVDPRITKLLNIKMHPDNVANFFRKLVKDTIRIRDNEESTRPDYLQHLLDSRRGRFNEEQVPDTNETQFAATKETNFKSKYKKFALELTDEDITAQAIDFFYGGFYSTASLMCFCLYELAINTDIQKKLFRDINQIWEQCEGKISYDSLISIKYLDMVISETLRKWPTATWIDRKSNKPFVLEPDNPTEKPIYLESGTVCWVPVFAIHRDSKYWPDPEKFDPERFNENNKGNITSSAFLPFGAGPRNCVGSRFAIIEAKLIIFYIILLYEVMPIEKTVLNNNPYLTSADGFWFGFKRRERRINK